MIIFVNVVEMERVDEEMIADLVGCLWKPALARLYMMSGRYMPREAKRNGASFGFCDADGRQQPRAKATHFGWTETT